MKRLAGLHVVATLCGVLTACVVVGGGRTCHYAIVDGQSLHPIEYYSRKFDAVVVRGVTATGAELCARSDWRQHGRGNWRPSRRESARLCHARSPAIGWGGFCE